MKRYIIYTVLFGFLFVACNPNADIYQEIKDNEKPFHTDFEITLTEADYSTISDLAIKVATTSQDSVLAKAIGEELNFSYSRKAQDYAGAFLDQEYIAADSSSSILLNNNYSLSEYDSVYLQQITPQDYEVVFGVTDTCFSDIYPPSSYLSMVVGNPASNYIFILNCRYGSSFAESENLDFAYEFLDGEWTRVQGVYVLTEDDYMEMGVGQYNSFSDKESLYHALPIFLKQKFPYASNEDIRIVAYNYYADEQTKLQYTTYEYMTNSWVKDIQVADQFVHNGIQWMFDPTVKHTMVKEDYDILVQYVKNNDDPTIAAYLDANFGNTEYYYGASAYYDNFDLRLYKRKDHDPAGLLVGMTDDEIVTELFNRIKDGIGIMCEIKYPDAVPTSNGLQVFYEIYFATYEPGDYFYKIRYKVTDVGEFEYESGPDLLE